MTYRVTGAGGVLRKEQATYTWHPLWPAMAGLDGVRASEDLVVLGEVERRSSVARRCTRPARP